MKINEWQQTSHILSEVFSRPILEDKKIGKIESKSGAWSRFLSQSYANMLFHKSESSLSIKRVFLSKLKIFHGGFLYSFLYRSASLTQFQIDKEILHDVKKLGPRLVFMGPRTVRDLVVDTFKQKTDHWAAVKALARFLLSLLKSAFKLIRIAWNSR